MADHWTVYMEPARRLRQKIDQRELTTGLLVSDHLWTDLVEVSARAGLDYLIVDMEHGAAARNVVAEVCATGRRMNFPVLIRPLANDYATIRQAVDLGPCGFLLACVESAVDLDGVRDALFLPPRGRRRPGGMGNRWVPDILGATWEQVFERQFIVLPQIETRRGLERATEIALHSLTTALAVGPYDLSAELGVCGQLDAPPLRSALKTIRAAADAAGKPAWMIGSDAEQLVRDGWRFLCIGEPTSILEAALREKVAHAKRLK
jgi:2-dehydro-3-deoxyglucarate aldolase/4-hydroxy-2-oxoheptanedioate aldolase